MNKLFYFLFVADIAAGAVAGFFTNFIFGLITALVLLFINGVTFYFIIKIRKRAELTNENR